MREITHHPLSLYSAEGQYQSSQRRFVEDAIDQVLDPSSIVEEARNELESGEHPPKH